MTTTISGIYLLLEGTETTLSGMQYIREITYSTTKDALRYLDNSGVPHYFYDYGESIDHGSLSGLADDDHSQYLFLAGRNGGQVAYGGTASGENLTLDSTAHATKGEILANSKTVVTITDSQADSVVYPLRVVHEVTV